MEHDIETSVSHAGLESDRARWSVLLAAGDRGELRSLVEQLKHLYAVRSITPTVSGLGLLQITDSVHGDGFHLGEFTLSSAAIELTDATGNRITGGAVIMADDEDLAQCLAILDAILAARAAGYLQVVELLRRGEAAIAEADLNRQRIMAATAVDFSTLDEAS